MKPIKLVMSAFGSYAEETTIDFTRADHGIFLITGDTGSGKTTIFDAICYALYDRTSAGAREGIDMRSQYASPDRDTFVEYTFAYGKDTYVIRRNPKYERISKRKDKDGNEKVTFAQPGVELIMPDGRAFQGKIKETNEKIIEIIGLDAEQFTQIVMIAQGEFMKMLQAPSNKRKEIFGRIFNTRVYWQLQEALRKQTKLLYGQLEDNRKFCELELSSIKSEETFTFSEYDSDTQLQRLEELIQQGKAQEKAYKKDMTQLQKQLEEKMVVLHAGEEMNKLFDLLEQAYLTKEKIVSEEPQNQERQQKTELAKKAAMVAVVQENCTAAQQAVIDSRQRLSQEMQLLQELTSKLGKLETTKIDAQKRHEEQGPELQERITKLKEALPLYEQARQKKESLLELETAVQKQELALQKQKEMYTKGQQDLLALHGKTTSLLAAYQQANDAFIAEQAGLMAADLQEGSPCPVCGSTTHPQKAPLSENPVTQEMVKMEKNAWEKAEEKETAFSEELAKLAKELEQKKEKQEQQKREQEAATLQYQLLCDQLHFGNEEEAKKKLSTMEKEREKLQQEMQAAQIAWQQARENMTEVSGKKNAENENLSRLEKELSKAEKEYRKTLQKQGFIDEETYLAARMSEKEIASYEKAINSFHDTSVRNQESIKQLEQQTKGKKRVDTQGIAEEIKQLQSKKKQMETAHKELYAMNQRNTEIKEKLAVLQEERKQLKQKYTLYNNLDKTANGNLSGMAKMDFQTYIQRRYFELMIQEANKRLVKMTSNQFILQCRSLDKLGSQGAVGLDLDVYSLVNDKTRDVKTLSGGESFMAALAMALGMSDVIQNTAGKVRMDTMFVDEGFGSLDEEARGEAIKILLELAGDRRLVGIISHVTELKEQIDRKLVVEKDEKGSRTYWTE